MKPILALANNVKVKDLKLSDSDGYNLYCKGDYHVPSNADSYFDWFLVSDDLLKTIIILRDDKETSYLLNSLYFFKDVNEIGKGMFHVHNILDLSKSLTFLNILIVPGHMDTSTFLRLYCEEKLDYVFNKAFKQD